ncbi:hypothetical protein [endosymbiont of Lamellibrachia barhami]|uniref:hypothetical protein n=1 Tax=endosymbiont of Lamellibrachia barhami TaxID=205975 RepID=UPI0015AE0EBE|nr:hypothetical protein [endosymbiont of Lamellibrachia barhami]
MEQQIGEQIIEGVIHCSNPACQLEYPIIDGIPIIVPNIRQYLADNLFYLTLRSDLSPTVTSMLGDAAGPGTPFDSNRQYLSTYTWDAYGEYDPEEPEPQPGVSPGASPGGAQGVLDQTLKEQGSWSHRPHCCLCRQDRRKRFSALNICFRR